MTRELSAEERTTAAQLVARARVALAAIADYDQQRVDRLAQAIGWALGNETTFTRLAHMSVDESGIGDRDGRVAKRFKIHGIFRDALRSRSVGIIEEDPAKGLVKYAKPAGVIASIVPMTNPELTPPGTAIYAIKARDAVIFSPHPRTTRTTTEVVRILREVMEREGAPADVFQCVERPSIPLSQQLMADCDLTLATGGAAMVKAAYSSGRPAFGVGGGNSTMVIDETADVAEAARNTRMSKTSDFGSGCSADGNLLIDDRLYAAMLEQLQLEGGYLASAAEKAQLERVMWDDDGTRNVATVAQPAPKLAAAAGFTIPDDRAFIIVEQDEIGRAAPLLGGEAHDAVGDVPLSRIRRGAREGPPDLRRGRQGTLLRHLLLRRRAHRCPGPCGAREPDHGPPTAVQGQRRVVHQRHADDVEPWLRHLGRQHHQREHLPPALPQRDVGELADSRGPPVGGRAVR